MQHAPPGSQLAEGGRDSEERDQWQDIHTTGNTPYMPRIHAGGQPAEKHTSKWGTLGKTGQMGVFPTFCNTTKCTNDFFGFFFLGFLGSRRKLLYDSSSHREELLHDNSSHVRTAVCKELLSYSSSSRGKLLSYNVFKASPLLFVARSTSLGPLGACPPF